MEQVRGTDRCTGVEKEDEVCEKYSVYSPSLFSWMRLKKEARQVNQNLTGQQQYIGLVLAYLPKSSYVTTSPNRKKVMLYAQSTAEHELRVLYSHVCA